VKLIYHPTKSKVASLLILTHFSQAVLALDTLYGVKSTSGSTQDFGTVNPDTGSFSSIKQISPTGLGWPLGDVGTEPDPILGEIYTRQTNPDTSTNDLLAIKKSDGTTRWLGVSGDDMVVGFDTHNNRLITRRTTGGSNSLMSIDTSNGSATTIGSGWASGNTTWQAGGIGAVDSVNRVAYQFNSSSNKVYAIDLDNGTEKSTISLDQNGILQIAVDHRTGDLYGLRSNSGLFLTQIDTTTGTVTNISSASLGSTSSNYVQSLSSNDGRYYYQAGSDINVVNLSSGSSLGTFTAPLRLFPVGEVVVGGSSNVTASYDISDSDTSLVKIGTGTVTLSGNNTHSNGTNILEGTLSVSSDTNLGSGNVTLNGGTLKLSTAMTTDNTISVGSSNGTLNTNGSNSTISGVVSGSGQLSKSGTGTLTLSGNSTNSGGIGLQEGILKIAGTVSGSTVLAGGELGGTGTLATVTNTSGLVAPGNSIGTLTVAGDYTQDTDATLAIEFNADGQSDKLDISGSAILDGAIEFQPEAGSYSADQTYTFIEADGGVSGTFSSQSTTNSSRLGGLTIRLIYNSGNVQFTTEQNTYASLGFSGSRGKVASYLDGLRSGAGADLTSVLNEIDVLSTAEAGNAFKQIDGDVFSSSLSQTIEGGSLISNGISSRIGFSRMNPEGSSLLQSIQLNTAGEIGDILSDVMPYIPFNTYQDSGYGIWVKGMSSTADRNPENDLSGYTYKSGGIAAGADMMFSNKVLSGFSVSYVDAEMTINNSMGLIDTKSLYLGPYLSYSSDDLKIDGSAIIGVHNNHSERNIIFTNTDRKAKSDYDSFEIIISAGAEHKYEIEKDLFIAPRGEISYSYAKQDSFSESGADSLNLTVDNINSHIINIEGKIIADKSGRMIDGNNYHAYGSFGVLHSRSINTENITHNLSGSSSFNIDGVKRNENSITLGAGYEWGKDDDLLASITYSGSFSSRYTENQIQLGLSSVW